MQTCQCVYQNREHDQLDTCLHWLGCEIMEGHLEEEHFEKGEGLWKGHLNASVPRALLCGANNYTNGPIPS